MKNKILGLCICFALLLASCTKENDTIENTNQSEQDVSVQDGRLVFKDGTVFIKKLRELYNMSEEDQVKWSEDLGITSYLSSQKKSLKTLDDETDYTPLIVDALACVSNTDREVQVNDSLIWRYENKEFIITQHDVSSLREIQSQVKSGQEIDIKLFPNLIVNNFTISKIPVNDKSGTITRNAHLNPSSYIENFSYYGGKGLRFLAAGYIEKGGVVEKIWMDFLLQFKNKKGNWMLADELVTIISEGFCVTVSARVNGVLYTNKEYKSFGWYNKRGMLTVTTVGAHTGNRHIIHSIQTEGAVRMQCNDGGGWTNKFEFLLLEPWNGAIW